MNKLFLVYLILSLVIFSCSEKKEKKQAQDKPKEQIETGKPFVVSENGFTVTFPSKPALNAITTDTEFGQRQVIYYTLDKGTEKYHFIYSDYPQLMIELGDTTEIINGVIENILTETKTSMTAKEDFIVGSNKGNSVTATSESISLKAAIVLVGNRLYQMVYMTEVEDSLTKAEEFIGSFSLNK